MGLEEGRPLPLLVLERLRPSSASHFPQSQAHGSEENTSQLLQDSSRRSAGSVPPRTHVTSEPKRSSIFKVSACSLLHTPSFSLSGRAGLPAGNDRVELEGLKAASQGRASRGAPQHLGPGRPSGGTTLDCCLCLPGTRLSTHRPSSAD